MNSIKTGLAPFIADRTARVGVVGLGYVGLPLLWTFHQKGFPVIGFDIDVNKIRHFENGTSYIHHIGEDIMGGLSASDRCLATTDFSAIGECDVILLCVPTPLTDHREPDMSYVRSTLDLVAPHLRKGQLLILESTTYPGTTEEIVIPVSEELSGLRAGEDFFVAYSPEREDPGNVSFETSTIPKVVGGQSPEALDLACALYDAVVVQTVPVSNTRTAEAVKLHENIFRAVNIAMVNELKVVYKELGIDVYEVIEAASTKPFGFMPFWPGPGLGGHCIPIDPFYLTWKAREFDVNTRFIELAGEINTAMPKYVVSRCAEALNKRRKALNGSRILCVGLAYKPNVDDDRESPSYAVMDLLQEAGSEVAYYDPFIPEIKPSREHGHWAGQRSVEWSASVLSTFDLVVVLTDHSDIDWNQLAMWSHCIVDTRNAVDQGATDNGVWRA